MDVPSGRVVGRALGGEGGAPLPSSKALPLPPTHPHAGTCQRPQLLNRIRNTRTHDVRALVATRHEWEVDPSLSALAPQPHFCPLRQSSVGPLFPSPTNQIRPRCSVLKGPSQSAKNFVRPERGLTAICSVFVAHTWPEMCVAKFIGKSEMLRGGGGVLDPPTPPRTLPSPVLPLHVSPLQRLVLRSACGCGCHVRLKLGRQ